jgi:uncharacterized protein (DUF4415 family)
VNWNAEALDWADPDDAPDLFQPEWAEKPAKVPVRRGRRTKAVPEISTTIRLDADVADPFRAGGEDWQSRVNAALREWIKSLERRNPQLKSTPLRSPARPRPKACDSVARRS